MPRPLMHAEDYDVMIKKSDCCAKGGRLRLMPSCHERASAFAYYRDSALTLKCARCGKLYARIAVATKGE